MVGLSPLGILSSTETLVDGSDAWTEKGHLPVAVYGLRGVSLNNNIFVTGNIHDDDNLLICQYIVGGKEDNFNQNSNVLKFISDDGSWSQVGQLKLGRAEHGASVVNAEEMVENCV